MQLLRLLCLSCFITLTGFAEEANYFRVWQGFRRADLSTQNFMQNLPLFMKKTVDLYLGKGLVNYLVVIPPKKKPSYIPDELALVTLTEESVYRAIRNTPEGKQYGQDHWKIFDKTTSKSLDPVLDFSTEAPNALSSNQAYDILGKPIDWSQGFTMVYIGLRKTKLSPQQFLTRLARHVGMAQKALSPKGLLGYLVIAHENYEVAYMNWSSKKAHDLVWQTAAGKAVNYDGAQISNLLLYQAARPYNTLLQQQLVNDAAYSTLPASYPYVERCCENDAH